MKRRHYSLPEDYDEKVEAAAKAENRSVSMWTAIHIMNAIDADTPARRVRKDEKVTK